MSRRHDAPLCGPDCRYRGLYEGTQRSLGDLAARQAEALGRVGRLRAAIVEALKRSFPREFADAERSLGRRLSDADDAVIVAYLESFLALATLGVPATALDELRDALGAAGVSVPEGGDLGAWAAAIRAWRSAPVDDWVGDDGLGDDGLGDLFVDEPEPAPAVGGPPGGMVAPSGPPVDRERPGGAGPGSASPGGASPGGAGPLGWCAAGDRGGPAPSDVEPDGPAATSDDLGGLFADDEPAGPSAGPPAADDDLRGLFADDDPATPAAAAPTGAQACAPAAAVAEAPPTRAAPPVPLRPQLFPDAAKPGRARHRRVSRAKAQMPDAPSLDVPVDFGDGPTELNDDLRQRLLAAVCIPRPVFVADLVNLVGSADVVAAWEQEMSADPERAVGFVTAKARHRTRGSLVVPRAFARTATTEFTRSWWAGCLELYRGARLYELAVLLHGVGEQVVSHRVGDDTLLLRLATARGIVGVVAVVGVKLARGEPTRVRLAADLEELMSERLVELVVLATNAETYEAIGGAVREERDARRWAPPMPVTLARSWEWVAGAGTADPLMGI